VLPSPFWRLKDTFLVRHRAQCDLEGALPFVLTLRSTREETARIQEANTTRIMARCKGHRIWMLLLQSTK
jgi:hypothetical protein